MLLSIIVPAYNVEKYIKKCIESILTQEKIEYEIIIINDESTDNTLKIIRNLEAKHSNIKVINQQNKGPGGARNAGLLVASGKYVTFVDGDDYLVHNTYGKIFDLVQEEFDITCYKMIKFYENESITPDIIEGKKTLLDNLQSKKLFYSNKISSYVCDKIYRTQLFIENKIFFPEIKFYEDLKISYKLFLHAKKVFLTNVTGYMYLQRETSISNKITKKNLDDFTTEYLQVLDSMVKNGDIVNIKETQTYRIIKYNSLIRMKMKSNIPDYDIDDRIKIKPSFKQLLLNKELNNNEKVINIIGENKSLFKILQKFK